MTGDGQDLSYLLPPEFDGVAVAANEVIDENHGDDDDDDETKVIESLRDTSVTPVEPSLPINKENDLQDIVVDGRDETDETSEVVKSLESPFKATDEPEARKTEKKKRSKLKHGNSAD